MHGNSSLVGWFRRWALVGAACSLLVTSDVEADWRHWTVRASNNTTNSRTIYFYIGSSSIENPASWSYTQQGGGHTVAPGGSATYSGAVHTPRWYKLWVSAPGAQWYSPAWYHDGSPGTDNYYIQLTATGWLDDDPPDNLWCIDASITAISQPGYYYAETFLVSNLEVLWAQGWDLAAGDILSLPSQCHTAPISRTVRRYAAGADPDSFGDEIFKEDSRLISEESSEGSYNASPSSSTPDGSATYKDPLSDQPTFEGQTNLLTGGEFRQGLRVLGQSLEDTADRSRSVDRFLWTNSQIAATARHGDLTNLLSAIGTGGSGGFDVSGVENRLDAVTNLLTGLPTFTNMHGLIGGVTNQLGSLFGTEDKIAGVTNYLDLVEAEGAFQRSEILGTKSSWVGFGTNIFDGVQSVGTGSGSLMTASLPMGLVLNMDLWTSTGPFASVWSGLRGVLSYGSRWISIVVNVLLWWMMYTLAMRHFRYLVLHGGRVAGSGTGGGATGMLAKAATIPVFVVVLTVIVGAAPTAILTVWGQFTPAAVPSVIVDIESTAPGIVGVSIGGMMLTVARMILMLIPYAIIATALINWIAFVFLCDWIMLGVLYALMYFRIVSSVVTVGLFISVDSAQAAPVSVENLTSNEVVFMRDSRLHRFGPGFHSLDLAAGQWSFGGATFELAGPSTLRVVESGASVELVHVPRLSLYDWWFRGLWVGIGVGAATWMVGAMRSGLRLAKGDFGGG
jgi:hypothetical protein